MFNKWIVLAVSLVGLLMRIIKPEWFYEPPRPFLTAIIILAIVWCLWMAWKEHSSFIRVVPRYGMVKFSHELIVKIINNSDFQITVTKFGFIHGWFEKFRIINLGIVNSKKEDSIIFLPVTIEPHDAKELIVRNDHIQWQKETGKIHGVYVETATNHIFSGKDSNFNRAVERLKKA